MKNTTPLTNRKAPRYHGRDLAVLRAHLENCAVLLGSATPSLESIHNALTGKYSLVKLTERADGQQLPLIRILDMKTEGRNKSGPNVISERLRMSIDRRLDKGNRSSCCSTGADSHAPSNARTAAT